MSDNIRQYREQMREKRPLITYYCWTIIGIIMSYKTKTQSFCTCLNPMVGTISGEIQCIFPYSGPRRRNT